MEDRRVNPMLLITIGIATPLLFYIAVYIALVSPERVPTTSGPGPWPRHPSYRVGGAYADGVFAPVNWLDRKFFHSRWQHTAEDSVKDAKRAFRGIKSPPVHMTPQAIHGGVI